MEILAWFILIVATIVGTIRLLAYIGDQQYFNWLNKEHMIPHNMSFSDRVKTGTKILVCTFLRVAVAILPFILIFWAAITVGIL